MIEDKELISRVLAGDMQAYKLLIQQNERLVWHMVSRVVDVTEDREEICQDVFIKVYDKLESFGYQSKLSTWIGTIAYRTALNHLKKNEKYQIVDDEEMMEAQLSKLETGTTPESVMMNKDQKVFVEELLDQLPVHHRTAIAMYHLEEMSLPEISEVMNIPTGTIKSHLFRGRKLLKEKLETYKSSQYEG